MTHKNGVKLSVEGSVAPVHAKVSPRDFNTWMPEGSLLRVVLCPLEFTCPGMYVAGHAYMEHAHTHIL